MTREEMKPAASKAADNYESVVLDFLNKQMAAVQPHNQKAEQTDDLDALVSDLLKQVLNESNQPQSNPPAIPDAREAMFAEFPTMELEAEPAKEKTQEPANTYLEFENLSSMTRENALIELPPTDVCPEPAENNILETDDASWQFLDLFPEIIKPSSVSKSSPEHKGNAINSGDQLLETASEAPNSDNIRLEATGVIRDSKNITSFPQAVPVIAESADDPEPALEVPELQSSPYVDKPLFVTSTNAKSKTPVVVAAAACLFGIIGFGAYHFLNSSNTTSNISEPQISSQETIAMNSQAPAVAKIAPPVRESVKKQASTPSKKAKTEPALTIKTEPARPESSETASVPEPPKNERPGLIQRTLQMAATTSGAVLDKLVPSTMPDKAAPVAPRPPAQAMNTEPSPVVSGTVVPAMPVSQVSPQYPKIAIKTHASAVVVLDLVIDEKGTVVDATPVSGPKMFHKEAVDAAMQWKYQPASLGGVHVRSQSRITMNFKLK